MKAFVRLLVVVVSLHIFFSCSPGNRKTHPEDEIEKKIGQLLSGMTLEEKIGQMNQYNGRWEMTGPAPEGADEQQQLEHIQKGWVGSMLNVTGADATRKAQELAVNNSRLGIPMIFGYDVIHGYRTIFPIPLGLAASWNEELVRKACEVAAAEASASGIHWAFAPMVDISRDARWGRIMEGFGEDPILTSRMARASVLGFQGERLDMENTIAACAKHYAAYGLAEGGRDYNTVDISEHTLRNVILPPFRACAGAGVATFMNSFNEIGGIPATASIHLIRNILKGEWNFDGFVVSDWGSIAELIPHGIAENPKEASQLAIVAGSDMDMEGHCYVRTLKTLVEEGLVHEELIDDAVRRILRIKFRLGLFDDPYKYCDTARESKVILSGENLDAATEAAWESIVLLKNDNGLLPVPRSGKTIAVIGPLAKDKDIPLGSWRGNAIPNSAVSLLEGLQQQAGTNQIIYADGYVLTKGERTFRDHLTFDTNDRSGFAEAKALAEKADIVVMAMGEDCYQTGEGRSQAGLGFAGLQEELLRELYRINRNIVVVLMNGRPLVINWLAGNVPAILETWYLGSQSGIAIADVLYGNYNPSGKLPVSFPRSVGQCPVYYNHKSTGRPTSPQNQEVFWSHYTDQPNDPLYPFGYGLSYTTFEYTGFSLDKNEMAGGGKIRASVTVKNTGSIPGKETVQLYIRDVVGSVTRPVLELKDFAKIRLEPGQSRTVVFTLDEEDLAFFNANNRWTAEPGKFKVFVGSSSVDLLELEFTLE